MDKINWILTAVLVLIGGFGVWYAGKTLAEIKCAGVQTKEALKHTEAQAKAASDQVRISELSMIASDRAYVHLHDFLWISHIQTTDHKLFWRIRPRWINSGNTPTRRMHVWVGYVLLDSPMPKDFRFIVKEPPAPTLIPPKGVIESAIYDIFGEDLKAVAEGKKHFYVWGGS